MKIKLMRTKPFVVIVPLFLVAVVQVASAQGKIQKMPKLEKVGTAIHVAPKTTAQNGEDPINEMKQTLIDEYFYAGKVKQKDTSLPGKKLILNVGWFDTNYQKISSSLREEMISLAVLTKGYAIGDTVRITIGVKDGTSLVAGKECSEITFIGILNYENLAFLQDVFSVQGEDEKMVIAPKWMNRFSCK